MSVQALRIVGFVFCFCICDVFAQDKIEYSVEYTGLSREILQGEQTVRDDLAKLTEDLEAYFRLREKHVTYLLRLVQEEVTKRRALETEMAEMRQCLIRRNVVCGEEPPRRCEASHPPRNVRIQPISTDSIRLTWEEPDCFNGQIREYRVYYVIGGSDREELVTVRGKTYTLTGLRPYTVYRFKVVAYDIDGPGTTTRWIEGRTLGGVPTGPPLSFAAEADSSSSIILRWAPPSLQYQQGQITGYRIEYKSTERGSPALYVNADATDSSTRITSLRPATQYRIRIAARTDHGLGPYTSWRTVTTWDDIDESVVPPAPASMDLRPTTNSIIVTWAPPLDSRIRVRGYKIGYGEGERDVYTKLLGENQRRYTIHNLRPGADYVVSLLAYNNRGDGRPLYDTVRTIGVVEVLPPPVIDGATLQTPTSLILRWSDRLGGNINDGRSYTVQYVTEGGVTQEINSTDRSVRISGVQPFTEYVFNVRLNKHGRRSDWSNAYRVTTQEAIPNSAPESLKVTPVDSVQSTGVKSVLVQWLAPRFSNGQILEYILYYTTNPSQPDGKWQSRRVAGDTSYTQIDDLTSGIKYYFKIQARNRRGYGPMSATLLYVTIVGEHHASFRIST